MEKAGSSGEKTAPASAKAALRARMRAARGALTAEERAAQSAQACARLLELPAMRRARAVALYWPIDSELDVRPALRALAARGARVALPVTLAGRRLAFALVDRALLAHIIPQSPHRGVPDTDGPRAATGAPGGRTDGPTAATVPDWLAHPAQPLDRMPDGLVPVEPATLDAIVVPGLAFDADCRRLGYGGGYYDALLGGMRGVQRHPFTCGVGFDCQLCDAPLPAEAHDAMLDCVVTASWALPASR